MRTYFLDAVYLQNMGGALIKQIRTWQNDIMNNVKKKKKWGDIFSVF